MPGRLRPTAAAVGIGVLTGLTGLVAPVVFATPAAMAAPGSTAPRQTTTEPVVRVSVQGMSPRDLTTGHGAADLSLSGHLTNTGPVRLDAVRLRVQRGPVIGTRSELRQTDDTTATFPVVRSCDWQQPVLPHGLAPGASVPFTYRCHLDSLDMSLIGIYPLAMRVQARPDGNPVFQPVGEVRTYLPSFPDGVTARTQVNWLWPLVDRPHQLAEADRFLDDGLGTSVSPGGRLDRMLSLAEHAPRGVQLTLVVDPALIDALDQMSDGYQVRTRSGWAAGRYGAAAAAWLDRVRAVATRYPVAALPYGDPDVVALTRAGLPDLTRITPEDADLISDRLDTDPITTLAWPADGALTPEALTALVRQGTQAVVLDASALPGGPLTGPTPGAVTRLHNPSRTQAVALVPDADVSAIVRGSAHYPAGPRLAEQRYLAELAMITAEAPSRGRELLVVPPRRWDPDPASAAAMLSDTATVSWLAAGSAAELAHHRPDVDRGPLVYPDAARQAELPHALVTDLATTQTRIEDFRSALLDRRAAEDIVEPYAQALRRAASSAWRGSRSLSRYVADLRDQMAELRSSVHIVRPSGSGVYVLASSDSPLFLTVANRLSEPVRFRVQISGRGTPGFEVNDIGEQVIEAHTRRTIQVPARVERSGLFVVDALVTTPSGQPLGVNGAPVQLKVRSTAYGLIGLVITGVALALLMLLILRRLVLGIRRHRRSGRTGSAGSSTVTDGILEDGTGLDGTGLDGTGLDGTGLDGTGVDPDQDLLRGPTVSATIGAPPTGTSVERSTV